MTHECTNKISGMKELVIKNNDYLKYFKVCLNKENNQISQISFITNLKKEISVGIKNENEIIDNLNGDDVLVGFHGYFKKQINSIGGIYISKKDFIKKLLFGFFLLKNYGTKNKKFKEEWDIKYKKLDKEFQYIWKTINLPDSVFSIIMKCCFI